MSSKMKVEVKPQTKPEVQVAETPVKTAKAKKAVVIPDGKFKCQHCGKWITKESEIEAAQGDYCMHLRNDLGYTTESLIEHRCSMTVAIPPEGFVKLASIDRMCKAQQIPISCLVAAIGKDRGIDPPLHPKFKPVYSGNARWLDPWCGTKEGLDFLRSLMGGAKKATVKKDILVEVLATAKTE